MGVITADFNNDGWPDIAIANDTWPNFLFMNKHDGTFSDESLISGLAASEDGSLRSRNGQSTPPMWTAMDFSMSTLRTWILN